MSIPRIALASAAVLAFAGEASARQAGYVFLKCDYLPPNADRASVIYRIGNGRWDVLADGAWTRYTGAECGTEGAVSTGTARTSCTFDENEFRSVTNFSGAGGSATYALTISRVTGRLQDSIRDSIGHETSTAQCRSIAEPKTAQRQF
jgi:hypothetical protein